jgi:hypothetical protein
MASVSLRVVCHLFRETFTVGTIVRPSARKSVRVALQSMNLFNLATIRKSNIPNTEYTGIVVLVG